MGIFPWDLLSQRGYHWRPVRSLGSLAHPKVSPLASVLERNWPEQGAGLSLPDCPSACVRLPVRTLSPAPSCAKVSTEPQALGLQCSWHLLKRFGGACEERSTHPSSPSTIAAQCQAVLRVWSQRHERKPALPSGCSPLPVLSASSCWN